MISLVVLYGELDHRRLSGKRIGNAGDGQVYAGQQRIRVLRVSSGCIGGHHVRSQNGASKGVTPGGMWQLAHSESSELESAWVVDSGDEIDIVVAGAAGSPRGLGHKHFGLGGAGGLAVADFATARIGGIDHCRKVIDRIHVADDFVRYTGGMGSSAVTHTR